MLPRTAVATASYAAQQIKTKSARPNQPTVGRRGPGCPTLTAGRRMALQKTAGWGHAKSAAEKPAASMIQSGRMQLGKYN